jgi:hypothetical protein
LIGKTNSDPNSSQILIPAVFDPETSGDAVTRKFERGGDEFGVDHDLKPPWPQSSDSPNKPLRAVSPIAEEARSQSNALRPARADPESL